MRSLFLCYKFAPIMSAVQVRSAVFCQAKQIVRFSHKQRNINSFSAVQNTEEYRQACSFLLLSIPLLLINMQLVVLLCCLMTLLYENHCLLIQHFHHGHSCYQYCALVCLSPFTFPSTFRYVLHRVIRCDSYLQWSEQLFRFRCCEKND